MDIQYLLFLQNLNESTGNFLRPAAEFISDLGASTLAVIVVMVIYWSIDKKLGTRILLAFTMGAIINQTLKNVLCINRPWVRDSRIVPTQSAIDGAGGYSFPSGHSQCSVDVYGTISHYTKDKKKAISIVSCIIMFLVPLSRNVLGVHTPQDVLVGMGIGAVGIFLMLKVEKWLEEKTNNDIILLIIGTVVSILHLLYVSLKDYDIVYADDGSLLVDPIIMVKDCYVICGILIGTLIGLVIERRFVQFKMDGTILFRVLRSLLGIIIFVALKELFGLMTFMHVWYREFITMLVLFTLAIGIWPAVFGVLEKKFSSHN